MPIMSVISLELRVLNECILVDLFVLYSQIW